MGILGSIVHNKWIIQVKVYLTTSGGLTNALSIEKLDILMLLRTSSALIASDSLAIKLRCLFLYF